MTRLMSYGPDLEGDTNIVTVTVLGPASVGLGVAVAGSGRPPFEAAFTSENFKRFDEFLRGVIADIEECGFVPFTTPGGEEGSAFVHEHEETKGMVVIEFSSPGGGLDMSFTPEQFATFERFIHDFAAGWAA